MAYAVRRRLPRARTLYICRHRRVPLRFSHGQSFYLFHRHCYYAPLRRARATAAARLAAYHSTAIDDLVNLEGDILGKITCFYSGSHLNSTDNDSTVS